MRVIVYTRPADGGVDIVVPAPNTLRGMCLGGAPIPRGVPMRRHVENLIREGMAADFAQRFMRAVWFGGCTEAEALYLIRGHSVPADAQAVEAWDEDQIPADRWFRAAWRRSHNGGPIVLDTGRLADIQAQRIMAAQDFAVRRWKKNCLRLPKPPELDLDWITKDLFAVQYDPDRLRNVWPAHLGNPPCPAS